MERRAVPNPELRIYSGRSRPLRLKSSKVMQRLERLLERADAKEWQEGLVILPYGMLIEVDILFDSHVEYLTEVHQTIRRLVESLPEDYRAPYQYCIDVLAKGKQESEDAADLNVIDVGRAIEYLTIVSTRFILDKVRQEVGGDEVGLQGIEDVPRRISGGVRVDILLLHNYGPQLDPLIDECLRLSAEKMRHTIRGEPMDMVAILQRKWHKYRLSEEQEQARKANVLAWIQRLFSQAITWLQALSS